MSLREKSAWIAAILVLICFGGYFGALVTGAVPHRGAATVKLLFDSVLAFVVLQIVLNAAAALTTPRQERSMKDERERLILARSHTVGYYLLAVLVVCLGIPAHLGHPVPDLLNFALLDVVIAGLAVSIAQIVMFRRGL